MGGHMESLQALENWAFPIIDLLMMICSLVLIRHPGGIFLGLGFAATAVASASWPVSDMLVPEQGIEEFYNIVTHFSFSFYVLAAILTITGISQLGKALQTK